MEEEKQITSIPVASLVQVGEIVVSSSFDNLDEISKVIKWLVTDDDVKEYLEGFEKKKIRDRGGSYLG